jgi:hypothetical protein
MARGKKTEDLTILQMALIGYQVERQKIDDKIGQIQTQLGGKRAPAPSAKAAKNAKRPKRVLSASARARISAAQKKRWAEHRRRQAAAARK